MPVTVKVEFIGVCTLIPAQYIFPSPPAGVSHRFVLVDASLGATINGKPIPPHEASMTIDPASIRSMEAPVAGLREIRRGNWLLRGVRLSIEDAQAPSEVLPVGELEAVLLPTMQKQAGGVPTVLDPDVVACGGAACYFDITGGMLVVSNVGEAATSCLYIQTPGQPRLRIETFWNGSVSHFSLQMPAKIVLSNVGGFEDSRYDFLLHYKVGHVIPSLITPPGPAKGNLLSGLTAGCSNSNYP